MSFISFSRGCRIFREIFIVSSYYLSASRPPCGIGASRSETSRCDEWHGQRMVGIRRVIGLVVKTMFLIIPSSQESSYRFDDDVTGQAGKLCASRSREQGFAIRRLMRDP